MTCSARGRTGDKLRKVVLLTLMFTSIATAASTAGGSRPTVRYELTNGLRLVIRRNLGSEIVSLAMFVEGGPVIEKTGQDGLSNFVARMILRGTENKSAREIADGFDTCGAEIKGTGGWDYLRFNLRVPRDEYQESITLLAECLTSPIFDDNEISRMKQKITGDIAREEDDMFESTFKLFNNTHYRDHPYGKPTLGTKETVARFDRASLVSFCTRQVRPENTLIVIVGDVPVHQVLEAMRKTFGGWERGTESPDGRTHSLVEAAPPPDITFGDRSSVVRKKREQTYIVTGVTVPSSSAQEYPVLRVIDFLLGGGMSSRLFVTLREQRSLAYHVSSLYTIKNGPSSFILYGGCAPDKEQELLLGLIKQARSLREKLVSQEELSRAKSSLKGNIAMRNQISLNQAATLGKYELQEAGFELADRLRDLIDTVTAEQIQQTAQRYFKPESWTIAITRGTTGE